MKYIEILGIVMMAAKNTEISEEIFIVEQNFRSAYIRSSSVQ